MGKNAKNSKIHWWNDLSLHHSKRKDRVKDSTPGGHQNEVSNQFNSSNDAAWQSNSMAVPVVHNPGFQSSEVCLDSAIGNSHAIVHDTDILKKKKQHKLKEILEEIDSMSIESYIANDAYEEALQRLSKEDYKFLSAIGEKGEIYTLMKQLQARDLENQSQSLLNRENIRSSVEKVGMVCDYVKLLTPFIPVPQIGTALDLIKGVTGIMLGICGIYQDLTGNIQVLLDSVPILNKYQRVVKSDYSSEDIFKNLVKAYTCLLYFYTWIMEFFMKDRFIDRVFESFRSEIPGIVSNFQEVVAKLQSLAQAEAVAIIMEAKQQEVKKFVEDTFKGCQALTYDNTYEKMSLSACEWLLDEQEFKDWLGGPRGLLTMFGKMGCGKSATAAYVRKHLQDQGKDSNMPVLEHRCKGQEASSSIPLNLYQNLTYQLLRAKPKLQANFKEWYDRCQQDMHPFPLNKSDPPLLQNYLKTTIQETGVSTIFIIVDGLDEMKKKDRKELLIFLRELVKGGSYLKVFLTSRESESDEIHHELGRDEQTPTSTLSQGGVPIFHIAMKPGQERDFILAEYLLAQYSDWSDEETSDDLLRKAAIQLSKTAQGSAIWLQMAAQTLEGRNLADEHGFERQLQWLQDGPPLVSLYGTLFDRQNKVNPGKQARSFLEKALEILAVAQRPLAGLELSCAVCMDENRTGSLSLTQLNDQAKLQESFVRRLVSPFVSFPGIQGRMELVHPSLLELVVKAPPGRWKKLQETDSDSENSDSDSESDRQRKARRAQRQAEVLKRRAKLHAKMLNSCVTYVMFDELHERNIQAALEGDGTAEQAGLLGWLQNFDCPNDDMADGEENAVLELPFDPADHGFGVFFAYAGAFWLHHFAECPPERRPSLSVLASLCAHDTQCLKNWAEMWKRPSSKYVVELPYIDVKELDPLLVFSHVEPTAATLVSIAKVKEDEPHCFQEFTEWKLLMALTKSGHVEVVRDLFDDYHMGKQLLTWPCVLGDILLWLHESVRYEKARGKVTEDWPGTLWINVFDVIIEKLGGSVSEGARYALEVACRTGCLVLVERLFKVADLFPAVRTNLLSVQDKPEDTYQTLGIYKHQPLGVAAHYGHADIIQFLCQQEGIEPQLRYANAGGYNVFHTMAAPQSRYDERILSTILEKWPDGIHQPCKTGDTALNVLVFSSLAGPESSEILTTWLRLIQYEPSVLDGEPMRVATAKCDLGACRALIREGKADPWKVVEVGEDSQPKLRKERRFAHEGLPEMEKQLLDTICTLIPISVGAD